MEASLIAPPCSRIVPHTPSPAATRVLMKGPRKLLRVVNVEIDRCSGLIQDLEDIAKENLKAAQQRERNEQQEEKARLLGFVESNFQLL